MLDVGWIKVNTDGATKRCPDHVAYGDILDVANTLAASPHIFMLKSFSMLSLWGYFGY